MSPACPLSGDNTEHNDTIDDLPESASVTGSRDGSVVSGMTISTISGKRRRRRKGKKKIREVQILDESEYTSVTTETETGTTDTEHKNDDNDSDVTATLQDLRSKYGDDWLRRSAEGTLNSLLGLDQPNTEVISAKGDDTFTETVNTKVAANDAIDNEENSEPIKRRSSDEIPDAIDTADDDGEDKNKFAARASKESKETNARSAQFYSQSSVRETSPEVEGRSCKVNVTRSVPGDDSGLMEELCLVIDKEFIREQDKRGVTRVKWFLHSLEQMEMVGRVDRDKDKIQCSLLFNTVRKDSRERLYTMSEAGYSTIMALVGGVLEAAAAKLAQSSCLQCVKCQAVWSAGDGQQSSCCPICGSNMVLETAGDGQMGGQQEVEEVSLGIPACELLDLAAITAETPIDEVSNRSPPYLSQPDLDQEVSRTSRVMSVKADIHNHTVNSPDDNLPDLLPRPEPRRSSSPSYNSNQRRFSKDKSVTKSDSSSDISIISNPSEASIEVITPAPAPAITKTDALSPVLVHHDMESSSSDSMVSSSVTGPDVRCHTPPPSSSTPMVTPLSTPVKQDTTLTPPSSNYSSTQTSPVKKAKDGDDTTSIFHSCQEDNTDTSNDSNDDTAHVTVHDPEPHPDSPDPVMEISPINWDYQDFTNIDHRVQLYCELSLFKEDEDILLLAKGQLYVRSHPGKMYSGVIVVTNKKIYSLAITGVETEEPGDWLEMVASVDIVKLTKVVGLLGGLGVGLEITGSNKSQTFYRLSGWSCVILHNVSNVNNCYCYRFRRRRLLLPGVGRQEQDGEDGGHPGGEAAGEGEEQPHPRDLVHVPGAGEGRHDPGGKHQDRRRLGQDGNVPVRLYCWSKFR